MNGWIKKFADGQTEVGSDYDVANKKASWSRGRLSNMVGVELHHNGHVVVIEGPGEYWQSDDLEAHMGVNHRYNLVARRVQKKIDSSDFWLFQNGFGKYHYYKFSSMKPMGENGFAHKRRIENYQGKWFTIELDLKRGTTIFSFQENRI